MCDWTCFAICAWSHWIYPCTVPWISPCDMHDRWLLHIQFSPHTTTHPKALRHKCLFQNQQNRRLLFLSDIILHSASPPFKADNAGADGASAGLQPPDVNGGKSSPKPKNFLTSRRRKSRAGLTGLDGEGGSPMQGSPMQGRLPMQGSAVRSSPFP